MSTNTFHEPLALTIISSIFLGSAGLVSAWIAFDIVRRRGWRTMMGVMIPVYILNALYLAPITLPTYLKYGRPPKPGHGGGSSCHGPEKKVDDGTMDHHHHHHDHDHAAMEKGHDHTHHEADAKKVEEGTTDHQHHHDHDHDHAAMAKGHDHAHHDTDAMKHDHSQHEMKQGHDHSHMHHNDPNRPMFATITIAVCHCGAGCLLGDLIGEWIVFATNASINGKGLWVEWLLDYGFALLLGIFFQYFSIAPMTGQYGPLTIIRAAKADFLSLTFFEIGLFGWMAIFQAGIWKWNIPMNTVTYWWMMQVGMFLGHWTAFPINWWLITKGIKEPCA